jgi:hypothetical protein
MGGGIKTLFTNNVGNRQGHARGSVHERVTFTHVPPIHLLHYFIRNFSNLYLPLIRAKEIPVLNLKWYLYLKIYQSSVKLDKFMLKDG